MEKNLESAFYLIKQSVKVSQTSIETINGRLITSETSITANAVQIALKANQTSLDTTNGRMTTAEGSIIIQAGQIASKVDQTTFDSLGTRVSTSEGYIGINGSNITSKVSQTTFDSLGTRVGTAEGTIVIQAGQIATKAAQTTVDSLTGRVSTAEGSIVTNANAITLKVSTTDYNGVTIASYINQSAANIKISAGHIQLEGIVTVGSYFGINPNGTMYATSGTFSGVVNATSGSFTGAVYASSGSFSGTVSASSGSIGGLTIASDRIYVGGSYGTGMGATTGTYAFWAGETNNAYGTGATNAKFKVDAAGGLTATGATISGTVNSYNGIIGGWYIGGSALSSGGVILDAANQRLYLGNTSYMEPYASGVMQIVGNLRVTGSITSLNNVSANTVGALTLMLEFLGTTYTISRDTSGYLRAY